MHKFPVIFAVLVIFIAGCTQPVNPSSGNGQIQPSGNSNLNKCVTDCNILTGELVASCKTGCYYGAATDTKNAAICENIPPFEQNSTLLYDGCVESVAVDIKDSSLCAKVKDNSVHDVCLSDIAKAKADETICAQIRLDFNKEACISGAKG